MSKLLVKLVVEVEALKKAEDEENAARSRLFAASEALGEALRANGIDDLDLDDFAAVAVRFKEELKVEAAELLTAAEMYLKASIKLGAARQALDAAIEAVVRDERIAKESSELREIIASVNPNLPLGPIRKRLGGKAGGES